MSHQVKVVIVAGVVASLAACGATIPGAPTPAATGRGSTAISPNVTGSQPPHGDDVGVAKFLDKPCDLVKADQLALLGRIRETKPGTNTLGPMCTWKGTEPTKDNTYELSLVTKNATFDSMVENFRDYPIFRETTIAGLTAVSADRTNGTSNCSTLVRTSAKNPIFVQTSLPATGQGTADKSCQASEKVAAIIVGNLKG
ncbi:hypothetical protein GCM10022243_45760 [Saccharothrix violaceirubra]|uniref:DUF3558 domain-containing protein n=1 Tax=Saccharothrix violaceirubra TaxID=413306 RepID=A0A7W7WUR3_9PSEU|nr:DUF3558 domain-containing protein [Saccharothrix violaceirubra]MBB4964534.1 hypothetical protein [Saccharothrix violaceirubra]